MMTDVLGRSVNNLIIPGCQCARLERIATGRESEGARVLIDAVLRRLFPVIGRRPAPAAALSWILKPLSPGECRMRFMMLSLLVGCMAVTCAGNADATSWTSAKIPGEQNRAVQGCADDARNPGDWFCIVVRCDQPRAPLSLYFSAPGPDIHGDIKLVIDEDTFAVSVPASLKSPLALSTRAEAFPGALIEAMKAGSTVLVQGSHLQSPYNRISLQNSRQAIEGIEWACARPYPSAARFWRRLTRSFRFF